jgi:hypothetical protein
MSAGGLGVGSPIEEKVAEQLTVRQNIVGRTFRDKDTLLFLNSNQPWIRLTSGVNTLSQPELRDLEDSGKLKRQAGDAKLAKQGVLRQSTVRGGYNSKQLYNPIKRTGNVLESTDLQEQSTYRNTESMGFRPVPGITTATVRSKGSYGTLRESTVNFVVWSVEDLNLVEALYFRPGFTVLLEWGHTLYFNNSSELQKVPSQFKDFFQSWEPTKVEEELQRLRKVTDFNYDAVFGYIKNFNWTFRQDGGYDCSISIVSIGSLIESLRVDRSPMDFLPKELFAREDSDQSEEQQKSIFHFYISKLDSIAKDKRGVYTFEKLREKGEFPKELIEKLQPFDIHYRKVVDKYWWWSKDTYFWYFPLYHVLDMFNEFIGKTKDGIQRVQFYTGKGESKKPFEKPTKFITSRLHFSLDPGICILPEAPSRSILTEQELQPQTIRQHYFPSLLGFAKTMTTVELIPDGQYSLRRGEIDDILNIHVTSKVLKEVAEEFVSSENTSSRSSLSFIESILSKINDNLGGANELGLHEEDNVYFIVDRKRTPTDEESKDYPKLILTGTKTTITSLQVTSKLSNQVGSQVAIAAQGLQGNVSSNLSELLAWNKGLVDRHIRPPQEAEQLSFGNVVQLIRTQAQPSPEEVRKKLELEIREKDQQWFTELIKMQALFYNENYDKATFEELKPRFRDITARFLGKENVTDDGTEKGIIPVELSFTTIGLAGLKIGQAFKVERGVLPHNYTDRFGFIITGLEHTIDTKWATSIKTQFYALDSISSSSSSSTPTIDSNATVGTSTPAATPTTALVNCSDARLDRLTTNFTLATLSCAAQVTQFNIPQPTGVKRHPVYGDLTGQQIRQNLSLLAVNVLEGIKVLYPDMIVTSGYRNNGGSSQHEAGMAADIQFTDLLKLPVREQNKQILTRAQSINLKIRVFDQMLLEYKTTGTGQPWIHITFRESKNRRIFSTFLNNVTASNGAGKLINPLA